MGKLKIFLKKVKAIIANHAILGIRTQAKITTTIQNQHHSRTFNKNPLKSIQIKNH